MSKPKHHPEDPGSDFIPCGIEISYLTVRIALGRQPQRVFDNTPPGHQAVLRFIEQTAGLRRVRVGMEATGNYGLDLALTLHGAGVAVMVANPRAVRHFAIADMRRSKTDRLDAEVLRQYAARMKFQPWQAPSPNALKLVAVARRLEALTAMLTAEKNRLHAHALSLALPGFVGLDIRRSLRSLERAIERLTRAAEAFIHDDPVLTERYHLLQSVPGLGRASAVHLLAELSLLAPDLDVRQWVAAAGLDPQHCDSGSSVHRPAHISKLGNAHLRHALYMPALVAVQHQSHLRAFYQHLLQRGKAKMQALVAVMRKLLHALYGMFHHHQNFDGTKVYALAELASANTLSIAVA